MTIAERIFLLMKEQKKTQTDLAAVLGIRQATISAWKKKNCVPSAELLAPIANFLGVSVDYLCSGNEKSPTDAKSMSDIDFIKFLNDNGYSVENLIAKLAKLNDKQIKLLIEFIDELSNNK